MRHLAMTGRETESMISETLSGSAMRATPPSARMSAGTRSRAMTATAPASSEILACSAVVTSMMTPPLSISARPRLTRAPPVSTFPSLMMRCYPRRPLPEGDGALHLALPRRNQFDPGGPLVEHEGVPPPRLEDDDGTLLLGAPRALDHLPVPEEEGAAPAKPVEVGRRVPCDVDDLGRAVDPHFLDEHVRNGNLAPAFGRKWDPGLVATPRSLLPSVLDRVARGEVDSHRARLPGAGGERTELEEAASRLPSLPDPLELAQP